MEKFEKKNIEDMLVLTPMQEGMLYHYLKTPGSDYYFEQLSLEISGEIHPRVFELAWNSVIETNEMLRTVFRWEKVENPVQIVLKQHTLQPRYYDIPGKTFNEKKKHLEKIKAEDRKEKFDLRQVPFRITLCKVEHDKYELIISNHHILYDGWSNGIILKEFFNAYNALLDKNMLQIPEKVKFKKFVKLLQTQDLKQGKTFWREYLEGVETQTKVSIKNKDAKDISSPGNYRLQLTKVFKNKIEEFVKANKTTLASFFYCAWGTLLQKYNNRDDVMFAATVSGRTAKIKGIEDIVGLFINTLPLRVKSRPGEKIGDLLQRIDTEQQQREEHESTSLVKIKEYSKLEEIEALFDSILVIENYPVDNRLMLKNSKLSVNSYSMMEMTHYDLTITISLFQWIEVRFIYNKNSFDKESLVRLSGHFKGIVANMLTNPGKAISEVEIITEEEKRKILYDFNDTTAAYPNDKTIHELFEEQVERTPDSAALIGNWHYKADSKDKTCEKVQLTYKELNEKSGQLSHLLRQKGVITDTVVGILVERSLEMFIAILGILKAGGAYLPIDPDYPRDRIDFILKDSNAGLLFSGYELLDVFKGTACRAPTILPAARNLPLSMAYLIYTSGSTGRPKGVMVDHSSVVNILSALQRLYPVEAADTYLFKTSYIFDVSVTELFGWFWNGGRLAILAAGGEKDPQKIIETIEREYVTHINFVPSMFSVFVEQLTMETMVGLSSLKYIFLAGEALLPDLVERFRQFGSRIIVENIYGPTEAAIYASVYSLSHWDGTGGIPIGKPLPNVNLHILDKNKNVQPPGVPGELFIAGSGVARGYLNNPELTAEKFILAHSSWLIADRREKKASSSEELPMSYELSAMSCLYKTGDLTRWLPDGNVEFLGRNDHQVKVRGFRIELGEIEDQLLKHKEVKEALVTLQGDSSEKYLCAYIVSNTSPALSPGIAPDRLREYLSAKLPAFMVPSYFIHLERFPLTPSGKIDRKILPMPQLTGEKEFTAPEGELEEQLVDIWSRVLGIRGEHLGVNLNFFRLGGHSLKAMQLVSAIHKKLDVKVPLNEILNHPTVRELARYIDHQAKTGFISVKPTEEKKYYALSPAQRRLYVVQQISPGMTVYNVSAAVILEGDVNKSRLESIFEKLIKRHECFNTWFAIQNGHPIQSTRESADATFQIEHYETETPDEVIKQFIRPFDLSQAPLLRVGLIHTLPLNEPPSPPPARQNKKFSNRYILVVDMHHIISDGISMKLFIEEFVALYRGEELPPLRLQYKDYVQWQKCTAENDSIKKQEAYWLRLYRHKIPVLHLPIDYPRPALQSFEGNVINFEIGKEKTDALKRLASEEGATFFMLLLAIYYIFLSKICSQEDIIVGTAAIGRRHADLQHIIGMFVNMLAMKNRVPGDISFNEFLEDVKESVFQVFENQDYPFEDLVEKVALERDTSRNPIFDTVFALQDIDVATVEISGLKVTPYEYKKDTTKFDLVLLGLETGSTLRFTFEYCKSLFKETTIKRFITYYKKIITDILENTSVKLSEIEVLSEEEKCQVLFAFNDTGAEYPRNKTIHELFEEQAVRRPDLTAVADDEQQLTYRELNERSNRLARVLRRKGITPGTAVGLMVEPSMEMISGIIAVLKAGGTYLPIDPAVPINRAIGLLDDANAPVLLTQNQVVKNHSFTTLQGLQAVKSKPYRTKQREQILDFDSLPFPDRSLINYEKYSRYIGIAMVKNTISLQGTRGCPYNCAYCHKIWPKRHVFRTAENIFQEVLLHYNRGYRKFVIIDDIFNLNMKNSSKFFQLIIDNGLDMQLFFPNGVRGDILTKDYIDLMVRAGTTSIAFALETASPRLQKMIRKNLDLEKLRENIEYFSQKYPHVILELFTMHGFPTETEKEAAITLDFIKHIKWLHFPYIHILKIFPNTDMEKLAIENGVSRQAIAGSTNLAYHELPETLPFDKNFSLKFQTDFLNDYFLSKERLLHVLPQQMKVLTEDEMAQKYDSFLPGKISCFHDILEFAGIEARELKEQEFAGDDGRFIRYSDFSTAGYSVLPVPGLKKEYKILFLDISQFFSRESDILYDVVEPPLGLMYVMTYLKQEHGSRLNGRIAKSRIDFDNYDELRALLVEYDADIIGIRTLTFYKDFFHKTVALIRQWGIDVPILAGGPYATSDYETILQDRNVDVVVLGEGEKTTSELIGKMLDNGGRLPAENVLQDIPGIAFISHKNESLRYMARELLMLDDMEAMLNKEPGKNLECVSQPADPAYIIFTSGSTGKPKGAVIEHGNVIRLMINDRFQFNFHHRDVWTMFHSYNFDFSVWEMYGALLYGGRLVLIPRMAARDPGKYLDVLKDRDVTVLNQTPSAFYNLINEELKIKRTDKALHLRYVIFGGEALTPARLKPWKEKYPGTRLINMYGITETTVHVTYKEVGEAEIEKNISNIGTCIPTLSAYIMDPWLKLLPVGVPGELCVGGEGVGKGYLNNPQLTAEKFVKNVYKPGERLYRSGDLVKLLENGEMEYLGRIDHQVKIRGFRIELGEIERKLLSHVEIEDAVVLARENEERNKYLCAYIVCKKEQKTSELRKFLSRELPDYMIPAYFFQVGEIPLTVNGKVDRKALVKSFTNVRRVDDYHAPSNETEKKVSEIWQDVLGDGEIGIKEDFFNVGGDSIKAIRVIHFINSQLNANLEIADLYTSGTIEALADKITMNETGASPEEFYEVRRQIEELKNRIIAENKHSNLLNEEDIEDIYPMTDIERGMIFHSAADADLSSYQDQMVYQVHFGNFDPVNFKKAALLMTQKHPILRTGFNMEDFEEQVQIVYKKAIPDVEHYDIAHLGKAGQEKYLRTYLAADRKIPMDTAVPPLWRLRTFALGNGKIFLVLVAHHAILDGWSVAAFLTELNNIYQELATNPGSLPDPGGLKTTYKRFVIEQVTAKSNQGLRDFWKNELQDYKKLDLYKGSGDRELRYYHVNLGGEFFIRLKRAADENKTTIKSLCFSAYILMVSMLSYEDDFVVGLVANNRPVCEDGEKVLGCFLNTIPVRVKIPFPVKWSEYMAFIDKKITGLKKFDRLSLFEITRVIREDPRHINPLMDTIFNFVDFHVYNYAARVDAKASAENIPLVEGHANNNFLDLSIDTTFNGFLMTLRYNHSICSDEEAGVLCQYFKNALDEFLNKPESLVRKDRILPAELRKTLVHQFNADSSDYSSDMVIHQWFKEQAQRTPSNTAVVSPATGLTYREFHEKTDRLALLLRESGVKANDIVGIMVEPSLETAIGIMAVLKAGGAYLPIAPESPADRIEYMLHDSNAGIILTQQHLSANFQVDKTIKIDIDRQDIYISGDKGYSLTNINSPADMVYVIYTSGTTGKPKGVILTHRNLVNYISWFARATNLTQEDKTILTSSFMFDLGYTSVYSSLMVGAGLHIIPQEQYLSDERLSRYIRENEISYMKLTPSFFKLIANSPDFSWEKCPTLRLVILGGEAINVDDVERVHRRCHHLEFINHYGPTEATIGCIAQYIDFNTIDDYKQRPTIGHPIHNMKAFILDKGLNPLPDGVAGELCLSGTGIARGYLNRPGLTAEKFIEYRSSRSYSFYFSKKIYKTGDLARWLPDKNIEFLGRTDHQVKIRGFRIELGEIENQLLTHGKIKEAIVIAGEDNNDKYLCAYIVAKPGETDPIDQSGLREHLANHLPDYMVPSYFVQLDNIPLTPNGKVDRKALPEPEMKTGKNHIAPGNEIEKKLAVLWSEILEVEKEKIGIHDNFFLLGGHSLKATILVSKIHKELNINVPLSGIFKTPHIHGLAAYIEEVSGSKPIPVEPVEKKEYHPLSSAQRRLFFLQQMDAEGGTGYNMPSVWQLQGELDGEKLEVVFQQLIRRHESLRTFFTLVNDEPVQRILSEVEFRIEYYESEVPFGQLNPLGEGTAPALTRNTNRIIKDFIRPFDLSLAPLLRVGLIHTPARGYPYQKKISGDTHILMVDMHHIISDGISRGIFIKDFMKLYAGMNLPGVRLQYKDYSEWHNRQSRKEFLKKQESYWLEQFTEEVPVLDLPADYPRPSVQDFAGAVIHFEINKEETAALKSLALEQDFTLFMLLLSLYTVFLSKLSGQEDIVVGTPIAGRRHTDLESILGMFVNTLALRNYPVMAKTFAQFLKEIRENTIKAFENQDYLYEDLVEQVMLERDTGRNPLFDTMFVLQNIDTPAIRIPGLKIMRHRFESRISKFDLTLTAVEVEEHLAFTLEYCTHLFKNETIHRFIGFFKKAVSTVLENYKTKISGIEIISEEEKNRILLDFNDTVGEFPRNQTIHQLFEEQAAITPDGVAVVGTHKLHELHEFEERKSRVHITYCELNLKSEQVARCLREKGVLPDIIVGIMMERSVEMIIAILAILKAGGAYLSIGPDYPQDRIDYMLKDCAARVLLSEGGEVSKVSGRTEVIDLPSLIAENEDAVPTHPTHSTHLCYIIYTSGSTGRPKGVLVEHRSVVRLVKNSNYVTFTESDRLLQTGAISFDASTFEIWGALLNGLTLYLADKEEILSSVLLRQLLRRYRITLMWLTAPLFNHVSEEDPGLFSPLKYLLVGGDALSTRHIHRVRARCPGIRVVNGYGPTENTTFSTTYLIREDFEVSIPIGTPIANSTAYIVDCSGNLQPVGAAGELWVGGDGVSRGYLNDPELTAEKFVVYRSYRTYISKKIYKTGDLGRWLPDGNVEFLGRMDFQVKIRGFRVELGEIENQLLTYGKIKEAIVIAREDNNDKSLCAYLVAKPGETDPIDQRGLIEHLANHLPDYMVPAYFVQMDNIPLTPNGKVDRKALPEPEMKTGENYIAPGNETEKKLADIWSEILDVEKEKIGIHDNFFRLGGHSLKTIQVVSRLNKELNVRFPIAKIFNNPTIRAMSEIVKKLQENKYTAVEAVEEKEYYPLSSAQKRLYILHQMAKTNTRYNMFMYLVLEGSVDKNRLEETFRQLVKRNESLRTSFFMLEDEPMQKVHNEVEFKMEFDEGKEEEHEIIKCFLRPFDLNRAPLLRSGLIKTGHNRYVWIVDMYHIVSDGFSSSLLINEFVHLYNGEALPPLKLQYKDFSQWQNRMLTSGEMEKQETYWLTRFQGDVPALELPTDFPDPPANRLEKGEYATLELEKDLTAALFETANETGATVYMVLLAVFNILLSRYTKQKDIVVGTPVAGRRQVELEKIIGMFVNMLAMRNTLQEHKTFDQFLKEVRQNALDAFDNQDYQFEMLIKKLGIVTHARNPLCSVVFVLQKVDGGNKSMKDIKITPCPFANKTVKFDLQLEIIESDKQISMVWNYPVALFRSSSVDKMANHYIEILGQVLENRGIKLKDILISHDLAAADTQVLQEDNVSFGF